MAMKLEECKKFPGSERRTSDCLHLQDRSNDYCIFRTGDP